MVSFQSKASRFINSNCAELALLVVFNFLEMPLFRDSLPNVALMGGIGMNMTSIYKSAPINTVEDIPIFTAENEYTDNYKQISTDHLAAEARTGHNPFIPEDHWKEIEESTIQLVKKFSAPGDRILDVGVGLGRLLSHFPDRERYGVDISLPYLLRAKSCGINVCYALIDDMPYVEGAFDVVVCTDVLEHVLDLNQSIAKILRLLKPAGVLIVRVPYREDLAPYLGPECPYKYVHLRNFDESSLKLLFERILNCKVIFSECTGWFPYYNRLAWKFPLPKLPGLVLRTARLLTLFGSGIRKAFVKRAFLPCEINVVVRVADKNN